MATAEENQSEEEVYSHLRVSTTSRWPHCRVNAKDGANSPHHVCQWAVRRAQEGTEGGFGVDHILVPLETPGH